MVDINQIRQGQEVYGEDNQLFGTVEQVSGQQVIVNGQSYPTGAFSRLEKNRLYLAGNGVSGSGAAFQNDQAEIKVPVYEEQLNVGKRQVELGEVELQKTVTQEQVNVPVELRREEVNVQQVDVPDRPVQPGEMGQAFQEGTIRVPVRGEEAVVNKQAVVTGEVAVTKQVVADQQQIADTVRKEQVSVDKNYTEGQRPVVREDASVSQTGYVAPVEGYPQDQDNIATTQTEIPVMDNVTVGTGATAYDQSQVQEDMEVYSSDNERIGKVKEVTGSYFLIGRGLFSSDIEATYAGVQAIQDGTVILNMTKDQVDALT